MRCFNYETAAINFHWSHDGGIHSPPHHHAPIDHAGECRNVSTRIRLPAVAGLFYPSDPTELRDAISEYSAQAPTAAGPPPKALIVPHAGYIYSGVIAGAAYSQVAHQRRRISRIVLIGPSHRVYLRGMAVPAAEVFQTPLGMVPVDRELKARVLTHEHVCSTSSRCCRSHSAPHRRRR
jgi:AmmeMemoRadiSam system protein B